MYFFFPGFPFVRTFPGPFRGGPFPLSFFFRRRKLYFTGVLFRLTKGIDGFIGPYLYLLGRFIYPGQSGNHRAYFLIGVIFKRLLKGYSVSEKKPRDSQDSPRPGKSDFQDKFQEDGCREIGDKIPITSRKRAIGTSMRRMPFLSEVDLNTGPSGCIYPEGGHGATGVDQNNDSGADQAPGLKIEFFHLGAPGVKREGFWIRR